LSTGDNPYTARAPVAPSAEETVRRNANAAVIMAGLGLFILGVTAPLAIYFGHAALRTMKRDKVGLQHRGAALVGVLFGCVLLLFLLIVEIPTIVRDYGEISAFRGQ
jgi:hypothetical protein